MNRNHLFGAGLSIAFLSLTGCGRGLNVGMVPQNTSGVRPTQASGTNSGLLYVTGRVETMYSYPAIKELGTLTPSTGGYGQGCP
ncbi:MAG TPA: hypothetical protein VHS56_01555, partial [Candidatus Cybelea sp.]|nr:hypothetical protein [Candidatus Cybelea sp.]